MTAERDPHILDLQATSLAIHPWDDPLLDDCGHDAHSRYVELFWLGILGPSATWLLRRMVAGLADYPEGYLLDLPETAAALGLSLSPGRHSPFTRAVQRTLFFGLAHQIPGGLRVRRRVPPLTRRQIDRLPLHLREAHPYWVRSAHDVETAEYARAHYVAEALARAGDDPVQIEHRLSLLGIDPFIAAAARRAVETQAAEMTVAA